MNQPDRIHAEADQSDWQLEQQLIRLPNNERQRLVAILSQLERLDRSLGELHLVLPVVKIHFHGLPRGATTLFTADRLLEQLRSLDLADGDD